MEPLTGKIIQYDICIKDPKGNPQSGNKIQATIMCITHEFGLQFNFIQDGLKLPVANNYTAGPPMVNLFYHYSDMNTILKILNDYNNVFATIDIDKPNQSSIFVEIKRN